MTSDIFETPREVRLYRKQLGLTLAQRNAASECWIDGMGTDYIAWYLDVDECRVYNSLDKFKGKRI